MNDGAAALLLMSEERARSLGLRPWARIVAGAAAGVAPRLMGMGPVPAARKVLHLCGMGIGNLGLVELNEAFAVQAIAVMRELGLSIDITNVNGGAIALGHPLGCSGARILTTLLHEMRRQAPHKPTAVLRDWLLCVLELVRVKHYWSNGWKKIQNNGDISGQIYAIFCRYFCCPSG